MGWLYMRNLRTKEDMVQHLDSGFSNGYTLLKRSVRGNHYWAVVEDKHERRYIFLALMSSGREDGWGYKGMDETVGPFHYDCPLSLLKLVTGPINDSSAQWRSEVAAYWAERKRKAAKSPGDVYQIGEHQYRLTSSAGPRRGWFAERVGDGAQFRIPSSYFTSATLVTE